MARVSVTCAWVSVCKTEPGPPGQKNKRPLGTCLFHKPDAPQFRHNGQKTIHRLNPKPMREICPSTTFGLATYFATKWPQPNWATLFRSRRTMYNVTLSRRQRHKMTRPLGNMTYETPNARYWIRGQANKGVFKDLFLGREESSELEQH